MNLYREVGEEDTTAMSFGINNGACPVNSCSHKNHTINSKRKYCDLEEEERSDSPTPSLDSEASVTDTTMAPSSRSVKRARKQPPMRRRVSFDVDMNDNLKTRFNTFDKYEGEVADDIWWSRGDLKKIMKREGRLVLNLKIDASKKDDDASCIANSLKQSINDTFKKCVDEPLTISNDEDAPAIYELIEDEDTLYSNSSTTAAAATVTTTTTTTRGLERYIAPIMSAHREMVVKSVLITQGQLSNSDPNQRMEVLGSRYQHLSKIAANFAVVMGQCDAKLATTD